MRAKEYPMQAVAPTVAHLLGVPAPSAAEAPPIKAVLADLDGVKRVAVLGIDALGLSIFRHWRRRMPFLAGLAREHFAVLRAIMTSKTPVNFGCMVTGASMDVHGAVTKESAFACETLFDVLRAHGMTSAGLGRFDWTGNELLGKYADFSADGQGETDDQVEAILKRIVRGKRPHFLIAQYGLTDELFHIYGPSAPESARAAAAADAWLVRCVTALRAHDYGILVLADHGQHTVDHGEGGLRGVHGSDSEEDRLVPLTWTR